MKVTQSWRRDTPSTIRGESITLTVIYSSFNKDEIDEIEKNMTKGIVITETKKKENDGK